MRKPITKVLVPPIAKTPTVEMIDYETPASHREEKEVIV
jgi:hypothetical protein